MILKSRAISLLAQAGITVNGSNPWDLQVRDERLYGRALLHGSLGLGESYMDGWWGVHRLDQFFCRIFTHGLDRTTKPILLGTLSEAAHRLFNFQSRARAFRVGEHHYDVGNELYERMLDPSMTYTCGYWKNAQNLGEAQRDKLDLVCKKIGLASGMRVLDIGCGWGSFAQFAAMNYGASVTGITVSAEQARIARYRCGSLPVHIRVQDYRDLHDTFDRIVSLGMFEHVGYKNYRTYMEVARRCLTDDGLFLLHTIGGNRSVTRTDPWMEKYIFPNSMLPSARQITTAYEDVFVMEDWHNFGQDYDPTLMAWNENFQEAWPELENKYGIRFKRMWEYYLLACAGSFRARRHQLWQIVLSPHGVPGGYEPIR